MVHKNIKRPNKTVELKECLRDWCETTTAHGFIHLIRPISLIKRLIWVLLIIITNCYCLYIIYGIFETYILEETTTSINHIAQIKQVFPGITVCNLNAFNTIKSKDLLEEILREGGFELPIGIDNKNQSAYQLMSNAIDYLKSYAVWYSTVRNSTNDIWSLVNFSIDFLLVSCTFKGFPCSADDFTLTQSYDYGACYTFNENFDAKNKPRLAYSGLDSGLRLELNIGKPGQSDLFSISSGFIVIIHNSTLKPVEADSKLYVHPGSNTNIAISKVVNTRKSTRDQPCRSDLTPNSVDSVYYNLTTEIFEYSQSFCHQLFIEIEIVMETCGCLSARVKNHQKIMEIYNVSLCHQKNEIVCVSHAIEAAKIDPVQSKCHLECQSTTYQSSVNSASYPSESYERTLREINGKDKLEYNVSASKQFLMVSVYYEHPWYTEVTMAFQVTPEKLVGLIGGVVSLCGISFLTLGDVTFMILNVLKLTCGCRITCKRSKKIKLLKPSD